MMKRIHAGIFLVLAMCMMAAGCSSAGTGANQTLFTVGTESCSMKEAYVYLANMRGVYADDLGTDLWTQIESGDASAQETLENLVISRLLYIYCMDQMAEQGGVSLSESDEALIEEAAEAYAATLTQADLEYLGVDTSDLAEYYAHFALAETYYEMKTADVLLSEAASSDAEEEEMLEAAKAEAIAAEYEEFLSLTEITVTEDPFAGEADASEVSTNQFFSIYNTYLAQ